MATKGAIDASLARESEALDVRVRSSARAMGNEVGLFGVAGNWLFKVYERHEGH